jgi:hypothetical protein
MKRIIVLSIASIRGGQLDQQLELGRLDDREFRRGRHTDLLRPRRERPGGRRAAERG